MLLQTFSCCAHFVFGTMRATTRRLVKKYQGYNVCVYVKDLNKNFPCSCSTEKRYKCIYWELDMIA